MDVLTTYLALSKGLTELNPFMSAMFTKYGFFFSVVLTKSIYFVVYYYVLKSTYNKKFSRIVFNILLLFSFLLIINNLSWLVSLYV